ncbi:hypothetical protein [Streptomyces griseiscabiei]|uniref:Uncharacterized protein n=1 Tax=Streptomyces griseiscabiei TaxID=2993540 RepID=A0ABU4L6F5_9ACTN|nr:hypothetical protein [Streptomyces griseiscabiei]MBZ3906325.1 hypothetical protein [Streptomyces griseiscabiei]MDX2911322.1 hypothetical protein [Streptomyces griseiscabiei]
MYVELEVWPRMFHAWQVAAGFLPEATEALTRGAAFISCVAEGKTVDGVALAGGPESGDEVISGRLRSAERGAGASVRLRLSFGSAAAPLGGQFIAQVK